MPVSVPTVEKCPSTYDQYECKLNAEVQQIAKEQLNESDQTRGPSLIQLREFIAKHPQIGACRTDAIFLLRFLRSTKFNVMAACELLERYLIIRDTMPNHFKRIDPADENLRSALEKAIVVPLGVDAEGRHVVTIRFGTIDPHKFTSQLVTLLCSLSFEMHLDEELLQVTGFVIVLDFANTTMAHFSLWSLEELKMIVAVINDVLSLRLKEIHIVQLPKVASMIMDYCLAALSPKLKERIKFHKTPDALKDAIDESILPTIYGGKQSLEEANEKFRQRAMQERERLLKQADMFIDLSIPSPNANNNTGVHSSVADEAVIGSFRKLNVD
ncbi:clavesin-2-like isoform X1 [Topomyia yanbarensis]|uniref:clavesin-2-like isoform X1 n=1 Tax=Topomyia yanbarensis TaxID=2498891 RepID=UPI00273B5E43|nr:clavesin-2-like isoform X1 [Topomyia yanbarensis]